MSEDEMSNEMEMEMGAAANRLARPLYFFPFSIALWFSSSFFRLLLVAFWPMRFGAIALTLLRVETMDARHRPHFEEGETEKERESYVQRLLWSGVGIAGTKAAASLPRRIQERNHAPRSKQQQSCANALPGRGVLHNVNTRRSLV